MQKGGILKPTQQGPLLSGVPMLKCHMALQ